MVSYVACYPGQGAQKQKMALDLFEQSEQVRSLFALASDASGKNLYDLLSNAEESELQKTEHAQLAITLANRSATIVLREHGVEMDCHAGFSLGELSAYAAAGVMDDTTLFKVVATRAQLMAKASKAAEQLHGEIGMAAVVGIGFDAVEKVLDDLHGTTLFCANDNGPRQVVLSGIASEIERCADALKQAGARRIIPLKVSGPFHTPFMDEAEREFSEYLADFEFMDPIGKLYANVTGDLIQTGDEAKRLCARQLSSPVRWTTIMGKIVGEQGYAQAVEPGPGAVLTGLWKSSGYAMNCVPAGTYEDILKIGEVGK
jgi:[acyl-carrier-protein] S-malonyltransferase